MEDIDLAIKIPEERYKQILDKDYILGHHLEIAVRNGIPLSEGRCIIIPEDATNGDAIKALLPDAKIERGIYGISKTPLICLQLGTRYDTYEMSFVEDWWNAPYKVDKEKK